MSAGTPPRAARESDALLVQRQRLVEREPAFFEAFRDALQPRVDRLEAVVLAEGERGLHGVGALGTRVRHHASEPTPPPAGAPVTMALREPSAQRTSIGSPMATEAARDAGAPSAVETSA